MTHISEIIDEILVEWAYRVHDGMPNPKNTLHIVELRESMEELNIPNELTDTIREKSAEFGIDMDNFKKRLN